MHRMGANGGSRFSRHQESVCSCHCLLGLFASALLVSLTGTKHALFEEHYPFGSIYMTVCKGLRVAGRSAFVQNLEHVAR